MEKNIQFPALPLRQVIDTLQALWDIVGPELFQDAHDVEEVLIACDHPQLSSSQAQAFLSSCAQYGLATIQVSVLPKTFTPTEDAFNLFSQWLTPEMWQYISLRPPLFKKLHQYFLKEEEIYPNVRMREKGIRQLLEALGLSPGDARTAGLVFYNNLTLGVSSHETLSVAKQTVTSTDGRITLTFDADVTFRDLSNFFCDILTDTDFEKSRA